MNMRKNKNKVGKGRSAVLRRAFTLFEMIVSLSMIMLVSVIFIANYKSMNKRTDLMMTAQTLAADLHSAQNNSLGLVKYAAAVPEGGWGVSIEKASSSYVVFADLDAPGDLNYMYYDMMAEGNKESGAREITLPRGITINDIRTYTGASLKASTTRVDISFLPPDPKTNLLDAVHHSTSTAIEIDLKSEANGDVKTIRVNFLGLIEVKK